MRPNKTILFLPILNTQTGIVCFKLNTELFCAKKEKWFTTKVNQCKIQPIVLMVTRTTQHAIIQKTLQNRFVSTHNTKHNIYICGKFNLLFVVQHVSNTVNNTVVVKIGCLERRKNICQLRIFLNFSYPNLPIRSISTDSMPLGLNGFDLKIEFSRNTQSQQSCHFDTA